MRMVDRVAYLRGMGEYLPLILFGSDAVEREKDDSAQLSAIPGVQIVKAY